MPLLSMGGVVHPYSGGLYFYMADSGKIIRVKVTREALDILAGQTKPPIDYVAILASYRDAIEHVAARKYGLHQMEVEGTIVIKTRDVEY